MYDNSSTNNQTWYSVCVFLWMGFYVYVFKNKYCCLLLVVDLLKIYGLRNEEIRLQRFETGARSKLNALKTWLDFRPESKNIHVSYFEQVFLDKLKINNAGKRLCKSNTLHIGLFWLLTALVSATEKRVCALGVFHTISVVVLAYSK